MSRVERDARCPKCTALLSVVGDPCGCIDEQTELVASRLYRNNAEAAATRPWADLSGWIRQAWLDEAEELLARDEGGAT